LNFFIILEHNYDRVIFDAMSPTQREYKTPSGVGVWKKQLIEQFPDERKAIENFFSMVNRMKNSYKDFIMVKLLPIWVFNLISLFGLSSFFSHYFTLSGSTLKDVIEVNIRVINCAKKSITKLLLLQLFNI
jgi:all-trans-retinol 13,14-reductase